VRLFGKAISPVRCLLSKRDVSIFSQWSLSHVLFCGYAAFWQQDNFNITFFLPHIHQTLLPSLRFPFLNITSFTCFNLNLVFKLWRWNTEMDFFENEEKRYIPFCNEIFHICCLIGWGKTSVFYFVNDLYNSSIRILYNEKDNTPIFTIPLLYYNYVIKYIVMLC